MRSYIKSIKAVTVIMLAISAVVLFSACSRAGATTVTPTNPAPVALAPAEVVKPKPQVLAVNATTSGMFDNYYVVLDVTIRNDGADGMIILVGSINQANTNTKGELPLYLARNVTETVSLVLPLKWRGGDWTPSVTAELP